MKNKNISSSGGSAYGGTTDGTDLPAMLRIALQAGSTDMEYGMGPDFPIRVISVISG